MANPEAVSPPDHRITDPFTGFPEPTVKMDHKSQSSFATGSPIPLPDSQSRWRRRMANPEAVLPLDHQFLHQIPRAGDEDGWQIPKQFHHRITRSPITPPDSQSRRQRWMENPEVSPPDHQILDRVWRQIPDPSLVLRPDRADLVDSSARSRFAAPVRHRIPKLRWDSVADPADLGNFGAGSRILGQF